MASYKVIQDVEAEDKLLGPLTLRQFIYAGASAISLYLCYFLATHSLGFMLVIFLPMAFVAGFFAFPWGRDQPTEIWALAKIRFLIKPRRRIWDQSGVKELVTITVPKQLQTYAKSLSQTEVKSRLRALADTIDSRGWAVKNANLNIFTQPALIMNEPTSDRLVAPTALPQPVPNADVQAADDILDEKNNPHAAQVDTMIAASEKAHRQQIVDRLKQGGKESDSQEQPNNYWFLNQPARPTNIPANMVTFNTQVVTPGMSEEEQPNAPAPPSAEEENLVHELEARKAVMPTASYYGHLHTIQPLSVQAAQASAAAQTAAQAPPPAASEPNAAQPLPAMPPVQTAPPATPPPVTPAQQAAILQLANNDDLNVATIAREANRASPPDEVVIRLH